MSRAPRDVIRLIDPLLAERELRSVVRLPRQLERTTGAGAFRTFNWRVAGNLGAGDGRAPTAEVTLSTYERTRTQWRHLGGRRLAGTYFWNTVTGPRSVCRLEIATAGAGQTPRPHVTAQLLLSPALGCGKAQTIPLATV